MRAPAKKNTAPRRPDAETLSALREKARLDRDRADAARAQFLLEQTRGKYLERAEVEDAMRDLGAAVRATLLGWSATLPTRLEGLGAPEMGDLLRVEAEAVLHLLANTKIGEAKN
jgi:hypothetical protein